MASEVALEKGADAHHEEILLDDEADTGVMGTTKLNGGEDILLVPAPSSDPRGSY